MRSNEYLFHRKAGLICCQMYRKRVCECVRVLERGLNMHDTCKWLVLKDDWESRLRVEQILLRALRVSVHRWRCTVIDLRPRGTAHLTRDLRSGSMGVNEKGGLR